LGWKPPRRSTHRAGWCYACGVQERSGWPVLPPSWADTRDTVHMWTQIVGKVRLALLPMVNQWWQVTLHVSARGLTTGLMPYRDGGVEIEFDFQRHRLLLTTVDGQTGELRLEPRSVADFYREFTARLRDLDIDVHILPRPVEVPVAIPFAEDEVHASYDAELMHRFWRSLVSVQRVFEEFRSYFVGKASPVHFFWGGFDLAVTRFSGRPAPRHPGGVPNVAPWVNERAYNQEVSSAGYWPGGAEEGAFYSYAYPEPEGFRERRVAPSDAYYDKTLGEFLLPYHVVRSAPDPPALLMAFLQSTYEAAADLANWDRKSLEARALP
jgi:Family of unknown function (DUF5996)